MTKVRTVFRCGTCGAGQAKWAGRCTSCGEWNTLVEELDGPSTAPRALAPAEAAVPIGSVDDAEWAMVGSGIGELDRVLGGGFVRGSVTLLGGEPGIGKSTLVLQLLASMARSGSRCLLVSGEESPQQVRLRATRLGAIAPELWLAAETSLPAALGHVDAVNPAVLVIDSIQTIADPALASPPGSVGQVRECANALVRLAKDRGITVLLIGHVTKEGTLAGPRALEHVVDTVLSFEGDRHHALRLLRASKHRFGATGELGLFEMHEEGLRGVADPGALFLGDRSHGASGSIVACAMEGQRPLMVELQALVTSSALAMPRRNVQGVDTNRVALLLAVLEQRAHLKLAFCDVFASAVGGVRVTEPAGDLALALALASALGEQPLPDDLVAIGEVGLAGEIRSVVHLERRVAEAARLGFATAIVPMSAPPVDSPIRLIRVATVHDAIERFDLRTRRGETKGQRQERAGEQAPREQ
jgi:DNA repair protein RadA/Sms